MTIIAKSESVAAPMDMYNMTKSPDRSRLSEVSGQVLELDKWLVYSELNSKGEEVTLTTLTTKDGRAFTTNSATFIRDFTSAATMFAEYGAEFHTIQVMSGRSKAGREFITCKVIE
nr:MAG TPA: ssDNA binding protein [Caudoviricetes sp.]